MCFFGLETHKNNQRGSAVAAHILGWALQFQLTTHRTPQYLNNQSPTEQCEHILLSS
jgi:hypothetical protein